MGLANVFAIGCIVFSALLLLSSGFYWYELGVYSGKQVTQTYTSVDAVHGAVFVVFGLMGVLAGFKLGFPPATIIVTVFLFFLAAGLTVEIALAFTIYGCGTLNVMSTTQIILCQYQIYSAPLVGTWFAYVTWILPLSCAWLAAFCCLMMLILWGKEDSFSFDD